MSFCRAVCKMIVKLFKFLQVERYSHKRRPLARMHQGSSKRCKVTPQDSCDVLTDDQQESATLPPVHDMYTQRTPLKMSDSHIQTNHVLLATKCIQVDSMPLREVIRARLEIKALKRQLNSHKEQFHRPRSILGVQRFSISEMKCNDNKCRFYTGLTWSQFMCLWRFLGSATEHLQYYRGEKHVSAVRKTSRGRPPLLPYKDQLLLTLTRLRLGLLHEDLAFRFNVSKSFVTTVITTWIQFLYLQFGRLRGEMFPSRQRLKPLLPACFRHFKNIRTVIDCTEFRVQTATNFEQQGNLYSNYKSHTTFKVLVAMSPNGGIMYVSDAFEGSISDKEIVIQSGFLDHLHPGDMVMADRGFLIRDILNERQVELNIPPFLNGRNKFTPQEEVQTKKIAKVRIHVERIIERLKKFRLLQKVIPLSLAPLFSQTVFVCACLVNFQEPIVK